MANRKIKNEEDYHATMKKVDALMKKGETKITDEEAQTLRELALSAQEYEKSIYTIPAPKTMEGRKLKQKELAQLRQNVHHL